MTSIERAERDALIRALKETGGNKAVAAERLGIARSTLYRKIRGLGLENRFGSGCAPGTAGSDPFDDTSAAPSVLIMSNTPS